MNSVLEIIVLVLVISLLAGNAFVLTMIYQEVRHKRQLNEIKTYSDMYNSSKNIYEILDNFIAQTFDEYKIFHTEILKVDYVTEKDQIKMLNDLSAICMRRISSTLFTQLSLIYNAKELENVIKDKCTIQIVNFAGETNSATINERSFLAETPKQQEMIDTTEMIMTDGYDPS